MPAYSAPVGAPIWMDLMSSDVDKAVEFYTTLFGWTADEPNPDFGGYRNFRANGEPVAGLMASDPQDQTSPSDGWTVYLHAADVAATLDAATAAGAKVVAPAMAVGELGTMGVIMDPAGAVVGVWQPGTHGGFVERGTAGTPYWFDCASQDYAASLAFYTSAFGVTVNEIGGGEVGPARYSEVSTDGSDSYAGIMDASGMFDGHPSFWQMYVTADDARATIARAGELGGTIVMPGEDTPWGCLGTVKDPNGAVFNIATPPPGR